MMRRVLNSILCAGLLGGVLCSCAADEAHPTVAQVNGVDIPYSTFAERMVVVEAMYSSLEGTISEADLRVKLRSEADSIVQSLIQQAVLHQKVQEYGLTLTQDEEAQAQAAWTQTVNQITTSTQRAYPDCKGKDLDTMVQLALESSGLTEEAVVNNTRQSLLVQALKKVVLAALPAPTDEELDARYDALLKEQRFEFDDNAAAFESAMLGNAVVVYIPAPYRVLKEVSLRYDGDVADVLAQLKKYDNDEDNTYEDILANEDALLLAKADTLRAQVAQGVPLEDAAEHVGSVVSVNYAAQNTTRFSAPYLEAAMSIPAVGALSDAWVPQNNGYVILYLDKVLAPGVVPPEMVRGALAEELFREAQSQFWEESLASWLQAADITIDQKAIDY